MNSLRALSPYLIGIFSVSSIGWLVHQMSCASTRRYKELETRLDQMGQSCAKAQVTNLLTDNFQYLSLEPLPTVVATKMSENDKYRLIYCMLHLKTQSNERKNIYEQVKSICKSNNQPLIFEDHSTFPVKIEHALLFYDCLQQFDTVLFNSLIEYDVSNGFYGFVNQPEFCNAMWQVSKYQDKLDLLIQDTTKTYSNMEEFVTRFCNIHGYIFLTKEDETEFKTELSKWVERNKVWPAHYMYFF